MSLVASFSTRLVAGVIGKDINELITKEKYRHILKHAAETSLNDPEYDIDLSAEKVVEILDETHLGPSHNDRLANHENRTELLVSLGTLFAKHGDTDQNRGIHFAREFIHDIEQQIASEAGPGFSVLLDYIQDIHQNTEMQQERLGALADDVEQLSLNWDDELRTLYDKSEKALRDQNNVLFEGTDVTLRTDTYRSLRNSVDTSQNVFVRGPAGAGKTTLLKRLAREWRDENCGAVYFIDSRRLNRSTSLRESLGLSREPVTVFETVANELEHVLLVVDQLDNIHDIDLRQEVERFLDQMANATNINIVCSSRNWGLEERDLFNSVANRFEEIPIPKLTADEIKAGLAALGIPPSTRSTKLKEFVTTPLRLRLVGEIIDPSDESSDSQPEIPTITSELELWDAYYKTLRKHEPRQEGAHGDADLIVGCASALAEQSYLEGETISISPKARPDSCPTWVIDRLQSRHVIQTDNGHDFQVTFVHEELRAYLFARWTIDNKNEQNILTSDTLDTRRIGDAFVWIIRLLADRDKDRLEGFLRQALDPEFGLDHYPAIQVLDSVVGALDSPEAEIADVIWQRLEDRQSLSANFLDSICNEVWLRSYFRTPYSRTLSTQEIEAIRNCAERTESELPNLIQEFPEALSPEVKISIIAGFPPSRGDVVCSQFIQAIEAIPLASLPNRPIWRTFDQLVSDGYDESALKVLATVFEKFDADAIVHSFPLDNEELYPLDAHIWEGTSRTLPTLYSRRPKRVRIILESVLENLEAIAQRQGVDLLPGGSDIGGNGSPTRKMENNHDKRFDVRELPAIIHSHLRYFSETLRRSADSGLLIEQSLAESYLERGCAFRELGLIIIAAAPADFEDLVEAQLTDPEIYPPQVSSCTTRRLLKTGIDTVSQATMATIVEIIDDVPCAVELEDTRDRIAEAEPDHDVQLDEIRMFWKTTYLSAIGETVQSHIEDSTLEATKEYVPPEYLGGVPTREIRRPVESLPEGSAQEVIKTLNQWAKRPAEQEWPEWERRYAPHPLSYVAHDFGDRVRENPDKYLKELPQVSSEAKQLLPPSLFLIVREIEEHHLPDLLAAIEHCYELGASSLSPEEGLEQRRMAMRSLLEIIRYQHLADTAVDEYADNIESLARQGMEDPDPSIGITDADDTGYFKARNPTELAEGRTRSLAILTCLQLESIRADRSEPDLKTISEIVEIGIDDEATAVHCALGVWLSLIKEIDTKRGTNYLDNLITVASEDEWQVWVAHMSNSQFLYPSIIKDHHNRLRDALNNVGVHAQTDHGSLGPESDAIDLGTVRSVSSYLVSLYAHDFADPSDENGLIVRYATKADDSMLRLFPDSKVFQSLDQADFLEWWRNRLDARGAASAGPTECKAYLEHLSDRNPGVRLIDCKDLLTATIPTALQKRRGWNEIVEYLSTQAEAYPIRTAELLQQAVHRDMNEFRIIHDSFHELHETLLQKPQTNAIALDIAAELTSVDSDMRDILEDRP